MPRCTAPPGRREARISFFTQGFSAAPSKVCRLLSEFLLRPPRSRQPWGKSPSMSTDRPNIRAPRGTELSCKGWVQEAALRMLMNNLDREVAEAPEQLVVYGGTGK